MRFLEILPARHPGNLTVADVVGKTGLPEQLRQVAARRFTVEVIAQIAAELAAQFAMPSGQYFDFELSMIRALSRHEAATTTARARTSTSFPVLRSM